MRVVNKNYNPTFKSGIYNVTRELDASLPLSRALVDLAGCDIPWTLMANNKDEQKEKARKLFTVFAIAWLSPFLTLPLSNRFAMRYIGKLSKNFWSNNHKAIHISNKYLKNSDDMIEGLSKISKNTASGPLEVLYNKIAKPKYKQEINIDELLKSCGGDKEKFRKALIKSKNAVFFSDMIFSFFTIGAFPFLNNEITQKSTGQKGFSAEINMADKSLVEQRAEEHEKQKKNKLSLYTGIVGAMALGMSLIAYATLYSKSNNKLIQKLRNNSSLFDYGKGIYMSRLPLVLGSITTQIGYMLASRNQTERKDNLIRYSFSDAVFFGGDLLMASVLSNASDRVFKTKLRQAGSQNNTGLRKIFPKVKSIKQILKEVDTGEIKPVNKKIASGIFWSNLALIAVSMGYFIPKLVNKMIKNDVKKDLNNQSSVPYQHYHLKKFIQS